MTFWQEIITLTCPICRGYEICNSNFTSTLFKYLLLFWDLSRSLFNSKIKVLSVVPHVGYKYFRHSRQGAILKWHQARRVGCEFVALCEEICDKGRRGSFWGAICVPSFWMFNYLKISCSSNCLLWSKNNTFKLYLTDHIENSTVH